MLCVLFRVLDVCNNVKERTAQMCAANGVKRPPFISCRVTQIYDEGVCVYFYLSFCYLDVSIDPVELFEKIEVIMTSYLSLFIEYVHTGSLFIVDEEAMILLCSQLLFYDLPL